MKSKALSRLLAGVAAAAALLAVPLSAAASPADAGGSPEAMQGRMHERAQAHLDRMARRLEITASQQQAWATYVAAVQPGTEALPKRPAPDADAATLMRFRADLAAAHAQKLARVADATARLQEALSPEQRKVLDSIAREHQRPMGRPGRHAGPMMPSGSPVPEGR